LHKGQFFFYGFIMIAVLLVIHWGNKFVSVVAENSSAQREHCIILDAGHGGIDGGTTSCSGKLESAYNLEITHRLNSLLNFMGFQTVMIRTSDISVYTEGETIAQQKISDLRERVRIVNETPNALLLSIHQNYFSDARYHGAQVFYAETDRSQELARQIQENLKNTVNPGSNRMSKKSNGIYLMEHIHQPGILIECGFLSNVQEASKLSTAEYQKKLSAVIAASISSFLSNT